MSSQWKRFTVVCADGTRESVYGTRFEQTFSPGVGPVMVVYGETLRDERGRFPNAQGIHVDQLIHNPQDYELVPRPEDEDASD